MVEKQHVELIKDPQKHAFIDRAKRGIVKHHTLQHLYPLSPPLQVDSALRGMRDWL
jgi:hypothetical protein